jgi:hypothetical protein
MSGIKYDLPRAAGDDWVRAGFRPLEFPYQAIRSA